MIIEVKLPTFQYLIKDPTQVRYEPEVKGVYIVCEPNSKWKTVIIQTYIKGLPLPKEDEVLFKYTETRGYVLKSTKECR